MSLELMQKLGWDDFDCNFEWDTGKANIHMLEFFPCEQGRLKKFMKLIIDKDVVHADDNYQRIETFLKEYINLSEIERADAQAAEGTARIDMKLIMDKIGKQNALILDETDKKKKKRLRDELKSMKTFLRDVRTDVNDAIQDQNRATRNITLLRSNLQTIQARK